MSEKVVGNRREGAEEGATGVIVLIRKPQVAVFQVNIVKEIFIYFFLDFRDKVWYGNIEMRDGLSINSRPHDQGSIVLRRTISSFHPDSWGFLYLWRI